jgi:hypothetical protein
MANTLPYVAVDLAAYAQQSNKALQEDLIKETLLCLANKVAKNPNFWKTASAKAKTRLVHRTNKLSIECCPELKIYYEYDNGN